MWLCRYWLHRPPYRGRAIQRIKKRVLHGRSNLLDRVAALLFFCVVGVARAQPMPLGEPRVLIRSVKTHKGLLLKRVTEPVILIAVKRNEKRRC